MKNDLHITQRVKDPVVYFVYFESLCPTQQVFNNVWVGLPGLNHCIYKAEDKRSCSRTQLSASGEARVKYSTTESPHS